MQSLITEVFQTLRFEDLWMANYVPIRLLFSSCSGNCITMWDIELKWMLLLFNWSITGLIPTCSVCKFFSDFYIQITNECFLLYDYVFTDLARITLLDLKISNNYVVFKVLFNQKYKACLCYLGMLKTCLKKVMYLFF